MNPLRLQMQNVRTFERLDLDFPSGCTAIVGANGAGKSTILNAVDVALFAGRGELPPLLTTGEEELALELTFEHGGDMYRVRRQFSARGRGKTVLDFERCSWATEDNGVSVVSEWQALTRETAEQTQQLICDTLGLSRTTFRASAFLAQGDGAAFTEAQPRDRKAILAEILGLDLWTKLQDRARADLRGREDDLIRVQALIAGCQEQAARKPHVAEELAVHRSRVTAARNTLAEAEREEEQAVADLNAARTAAEKIRACEAELAAAAAKHARANDDYAAATKAALVLADKRIELEELEADAAQIPPLEKRLDELRAALLRRHAATMERQASPPRPTSARSRGAGCSGRQTSSTRPRTRSARRR
jgi:exonuclease SbcC